MSRSGASVKGIGFPLPAGLTSVERPAVFGGADRGTAAGAAGVSVAKSGVAEGISRTFEGGGAVWVAIGPEVGESSVAQASREAINRTVVINRGGLTLSIHHWNGFGPD